MQRFGRLTYISFYTPFSFLVFVVWKMVANGKKKGQAVVDIWKLNNLIILDAYLLPLQLEIVTNIQGYTNLAVLDAASFFY